MSGEVDELVHETAELIAIGVMGEELEQFWKSDVGKYLQARIAKEINDAMKLFRGAYGADEFKKAQNDFLRAESFTKWIEDGIAEGLRAKQILDYRIEDTHE